MTGVRVAMAAALTACTTPAATPVVRPGPRVEDPFTAYPAITTTGSKDFGAPGPTSEAWPWRVGQWLVYKRKDTEGVALEQLRVVAQDACGLWIERWIQKRGRRSTWTFCMRAQPSPDDSNPFESLLAVIESRNRRVVRVEDFRTGSADRTQWSWLVSLVHGPWPGRTDLPREDVATPVGQFREAAKVTTTERSVETTRWSHPAVPLGGIVKELAPDHVRVLVAFGTTSRASPIVDTLADLERAQREQRAQHQSERNQSEPLECLTGIRWSPKICETSPRTFLGFGFGIGGTSRVGDAPPTSGQSWRLQLGQRLTERLHLVEEFNSIGSDYVLLVPTVKAEKHLSFGAGVRWTPFKPSPKPGDIPYPFPVPFIDVRAFYLTAVVGANLRDRVTQTTPSELTEDTAWSPMASLAVGLLEIKGRDWSLGPEFREQFARYDGRFQRGWQLVMAIHLNGW